MQRPRQTRGEDKLRAEVMRRVSLTGGPGPTPAGGGGMSEDKLRAEVMRRVSLTGGGAGGPGGGGRRMSLNGSINPRGGGESRRTSLSGAAAVSAAAEAGAERSGRGRDRRASMESEGWDADYGAEGGGAGHLLASRGSRRGSRADYGMDASSSGAMARSAGGRSGGADGNSGFTAAKARRNSAGSFYGEGGCSECCLRVAFQRPVHFAAHFLDY